MQNADGTPIWFELNTADEAKARHFYAATIGWTIARSPMPEHGAYMIASAPDGAAIAGITTPPPSAPSLSGWSIYFGTNDVDATTAQAGNWAARSRSNRQTFPASAVLRLRWTRSMSASCS